ncbi:MAG: IS66 family transposase, partial [Nitrospirota bacterium]
HLRTRIKELEAIVASQATLIETLSLRVEQLETMIFGRRKKRAEPSRPDEHDDLGASGARSADRPAASYRRPSPRDEDVTDTIHHTLSACPDCHAKLTDLKIITRFSEDILPLAEWHRVLKRVTRHRITTGYCCTCRGRKSPIAIPPQTTSLGENVRQFVAFAIVVLRLSFEQVESLLAGTMRLRLSDGEVTHLLAKEACVLRPAYERLKGRIRLQSGAHYDETGWRVQRERQGNYAWVMTGTETAEAVFLLGRSRGKGNAEALRGERNEQVGISDDYGAYQTLFQNHQLCWAHPHRKLRDLAQSETLSETVRTYCRGVFESFASLYHDVRTASATRERTADEKEQSRQQLRERFDTVARENADDPSALRKIKERLRRQKERYFTCLAIPGIPPDNNKAERALRHLVLKRKMSFGSRTQEGADTMSVLYSVLLSLWWTSKETFFGEYAALRGPAAVSTG